MAIKFENTSGPQAKPTEKRAEAARAPLEDDKKKGDAPAEDAEDDKASGKSKKPRAGFRKK